MDMSLVMAAMAMKAGSTQQQIGTAILKQNIEQQSSVLQLLQPAGVPAANNPAGVGGYLDILA
ncbi:MAG: putative motility protein [Bradyrhizobiaceae bacterium]|nr:MAG: putative motility protein [Bradyrhizobiaceae bacterium]